MAAAKTQGTFVKKHPETGELVERIAHTPADAVKYRFDGWTEKPATDASKAAETAPSGGAAKSSKP